ncbi:MAG: AraC family transcriptional regulator, partial [Verrucomicrobiota bacterium]
LISEMQGDGEEEDLYQWLDLLLLKIRRSLGNGRRPEQENRLAKLWKAVESNLMHPWKLSDLAELAHLSSSQLSRVCQDVYGRSPIQYLNFLRLSKAGFLLKTSSEPIESISWSVGYNNPFAFTNAFKREFGQTPRDYRQDYWESLVEDGVSVLHEEDEGTSIKKPMSKKRPIKRGEWLYVDLEPLANRSLTQRGEWLGDKSFYNVPNGETSVKGIPFNLISERANENKKAVLLRSKMISKDRRNQALPKEVQTYPNAYASSIYFLHACGWVTQNVESIGEYRIFYEDGGSAVQHLIACGPSVPGDCMAPVWSQQSNIQDWWPDFYHFENDSVKHWRIEPDVDEEREGYLYILEWKNPRPQSKIESIAIKATSQFRSALAVFAISLRAPSEKG